MVIPATPATTNGVATVPIEYTEDMYELSVEHIIEKLTTDKDTHILKRTRAYSVGAYRDAQFEDEVVKYIDTLKDWIDTNDI